MPITASEVMERFRIIAQDTTSVRWPLTEVRHWINDAMREIVLAKPAASAANVVLQLQAGTFQRLPTDYCYLLQVLRNLKTLPSPIQTGARVGGRSISMVDRQTLDSQHPSWHDTSVIPATAEVKHVMFDPQSPLAFYVYPANTGTGIIEASAARVPTPVPLPGAVADYESIASYNVALDILDIYANAILDYVLYRAYSKDASTGAPQRAMAAFQAFATSMGLKTAGEAVANPLAPRPPAGLA
jgi:hypothetical protein